MISVQSAFLKVTGAASTLTGENGILKDVFLKHSNSYRWLWHKYIRLWSPGLFCKKAGRKCLLKSCYEGLVTTHWAQMHLFLNFLKNMLPADHNRLFHFFCHINFVADISIIHNDIASIPSFPNEKSFGDGSPQVSMKQCQILKRTMRTALRDWHRKASKGLAQKPGQIEKIEVQTH